VGKADLQIAKRLYSIKDAAAYLGCKVWTVREMIWAGFPHVRNGKQIFLDVRDVDKWIETNKTRYTY
jgi:excisionase family DNA binding protein